MQVTNSMSQYCGKIEESNGKIRAYDYLGKLVGWYDPRENFTHTAMGAIVGRGNLVSSLIPTEVRRSK